MQIGHQSEVRSAAPTKPAGWLRSTWHRLQAIEVQWALAAGLLGILGAPAMREKLESAMSTHMGLQIPLIVIAGWLLAAGCRPFFRNLLARFDHQGIASCAYLLGVSAYWMIPRALDQVLLSDAVAWGKFISLVLAGIVLRVRWTAMPATLRLFVVSNLVWMLWAAGVIFMLAEVRLCNAYLLDDQLRAGQLCILWGIGILAVWAWDKKWVHAVQRWTQSA